MKRKILGEKFWNYQIGKLKHRPLYGIEEQNNNASKNIFQGTGGVSTPSQSINEANHRGVTRKVQNFEDSGDETGRFCISYLCALDARKESTQCPVAHFPLISIDDLTDEQRQALERTIKAVGGVNVPLHGTDGRTMSKGDNPLSIYCIESFYTETDCLMYIHDD